MTSELIDIDKQYLEEMDAFRKEEDAYWKAHKKLVSQYKKDLKGLINVSGLFRSLTEDHSSFTIIGFVDVESTDEKSYGYPTHEHGRIKGTDDKKLYLKCTGTEIKGIPYYYCYQVSHFEDSYSGSLIFPLKDGRFFKVSYEC